MLDQDQLIEIAKLDGKEEWEYNPNNPAFGSLLYLTSLDAIVPVIEKQPTNIKHKFVRTLWITLNGECSEHDVFNEQESAFVDEIIKLMLATPRQLCEALLRATGKWKD